MVPDIAKYPRGDKAGLVENQWIRLARALYRHVYVEGDTEAREGSLGSAFQEEANFAFP